MFELMQFLHILGVAAWFGANLVRAFARGPLTRKDDETAAALAPPHRFHGARVIPHSGPRSWCS